jgi:plastocyanin
VLGGVVVAMLLGSGACGGGGGSSDKRADVTVKANTLRFEPDELDISLNKEDTFTFANNDNVVHNVTIPALSNDKEQNAIDMDMKPGERIAVKIPAVGTAPRDGFFLFYCKYHQTSGMSGRIKISK